MRYFCLVKVLRPVSTHGSTSDMGCVFQISEGRKQIVGNYNGCHVETTSNVASMYPKVKTLRCCRLSQSPGLHGVNIMRLMVLSKKTILHSFVLKWCQNIPDYSVRSNTFREVSMGIESIPSHLKAPTSSVHCICACSSFNMMASNAPHTHTHTHTQTSSLNPS